MLDVDDGVTGWRVAAMASALIAAALLATTCGGHGDGRGPTSPAAPAPSASAGPTPDPPLSASCARLPYGTDKYTCRDTAPEFLQQVQDAVSTLKHEHPEIFDGNTILNGGAYYVGLIRLLDRSNLCAAFDGNELAVKSSNEFSEQYRVQTWWREVRTVGIYMGACFPAVFPLPRDAPPPPAGCPLPSSTEVACDRIDPRFAADVEAAIDQVMKQRPELFDFTQLSGEWPLVKDLAAYHTAVVDVLAGRGFCGRFDGEEIVIKRSNEFSEHYDVNLSDKYVRRGPGAYRGSCYPAAF
jgi:hypothetical protein